MVIYGILFGGMHYFSSDHSMYWHCMSVYYTLLMHTWSKFYPHQWPIAVFSHEHIMTDKNVWVVSLSKYYCDMGEDISLGHKILNFMGNPFLRS